MIPFKKMIRSVLSRPGCILFHHGDGNPLIGFSVQYKYRQFRNRCIWICARDQDQTDKVSFELTCESSCPDGAIRKSGQINPFHPALVKISERFP